jgi:tetratricopeptide (TPR) repeat protein
LIEKSFAPHLNDYAQFYLKHKNANKASELISFVINKYPDNAQAFNILGDINLTLNNTKEAKKYYEKAIEIGSRNDDWRISEYKSDLINSAGKK